MRPSRREQILFVLQTFLFAILFLLLLVGFCGGIQLLQLRLLLLREIATCKKNSPHQNGTDCFCHFLISQIWKGILLCGYSVGDRRSALGYPVHR